MVKRSIVTRVSFFSRIFCQRSFQINKFSTSSVCSNLKDRNNEILLYASNSMKEKKRLPFVPGSNTSKNGFQDRKRPNNVPRKKPRFQWTSGSERAQRAADQVLQQVFNMNGRGVVKVVDQETNKLVETTVLEFVRGVDLDKCGLSIVNLEERSGYQIPLLKLIDVKAALKKHSDEIGRRKRDELSRMGLPSKRMGKSNEHEKSSDNVKHIKVSWQISDFDLAKQKANEISSQLKKGFKVNLYIDSKDALSKANWADKFEGIDNYDDNRKKISNRELKRREEVLEQLKLIYEELTLQPTIEGDLKSRIILRLLPKPVMAKKEDKYALKELRRKQKQAKLEKRLERKKQRDKDESG